MTHHQNQRGGVRTHLVARACSGMEGTAAGSRRRIGSRIMSCWCQVGVSSLISVGGRSCRAGCSLLDRSRCDGGWAQRRQAGRSLPCLTVCLGGTRVDERDGVWKAWQTRQSRGSARCPLSLALCLSPKAAVEKKCCCSATAFRLEISLVEREHEIWESIDPSRMPCCPIQAPRRSNGPNLISIHAQRTGRLQPKRGYTGP